MSKIDETIELLQDQLREVFKDALEENHKLKAEFKLIAEILDCPDSEAVSVPSNLPNLVRDLAQEGVRLRGRLNHIHQLTTGRSANEG